MPPMPVTRFMQALRDGRVYFAGLRLRALISATASKQPWRCSEREEMQKLEALCVTIFLFALYSYGQEAPLKMGQHGNGTFVGLVSDTTCGARHRLKDKSGEECTRTCVRQGAGFALVAGP